MTYVLLSVSGNLLSKVVGVTNENYTNMILQSYIDDGYVTAISILAKRLLHYHRDQTSILLLQGAQVACSECCFVLVEHFEEADNKFRLLAHKQKRIGVSFPLFDDFWYSGKYKEAMTIYAESSDIEYKDIEPLMTDDPNCKFCVGRETTEFISAAHYPRIRQARIYYKDIWAKRRAAVLAWMGIAKKLGGCKDISLYIGKIVFWIVSVRVGNEVSKNKKTN